MQDRFNKARDSLATDACPPGDEGANKDDCVGPRTLWGLFLVTLRRVCLLKFHVGTQTLFLFFLFLHLLLFYFFYFNDVFYDSFWLIVVDVVNG